MNDERGRSGLENRCNGCGDAQNYDPRIPSNDGSANGKSGVDYGSDSDEIEQAENIRGKVHAEMEMRRMKMAKKRLMVDMELPTRWPVMKIRKRKTTM